MITTLTRPPTVTGLLGEVLTATRTTPAQVTEPAQDASPRHHRRATGRGPEGPTVVVRPDPQPARGLDEVLESRHSQRFFTDRAVGAATLTAALATALDADRDLWPDPAEWATAPQLVVAALRVDGLDTGLHRFDRDVDGDRHAYTLLRPLSPRDVGDMVLQSEYADSPVIVAAVGSLDAALVSRGDHGTRLLNARASQLCYSTLLAANARGIAGSVFAGFLASGLSRHLNTDGYHLAQVFAVALGHPVPATDFSPA